MLNAATLLWPEAIGAVLDEAIETVQDYHVSSQEERNQTAQQVAFCASFLRRPRHLGQRPSPLARDIQWRHFNEWVSTILSTQMEEEYRNHSESIQARIIAATQVIRMDEDIQVTP